MFASLRSLSFCVVFAALLVGGCDDGEPSFHDSDGGKTDGQGVLHSLNFSNFVYDSGRSFSATIEFEDDTYQAGDRYDVELYLVSMDADGQAIFDKPLRLTSGIAEGRTYDVQLGASLISFARELGGEENGLFAYYLQAHVSKRCDVSGCPSVEGSRFVAAQIRPLNGTRISDGDYFKGGVEQDAVTTLLGEMENHCKKVLVMVPGTKHENKMTVNGATGFLEGGGYDCLVGVSYHAQGTETGTTSKNSRHYCASLELGLDSVNSVFSAFSEKDKANLPYHFDFYGHSKGAAILVNFWRSLSADSDFPEETRFYAVGLPHERAAEYIPNYERGRINRNGRLISFTWDDDGVAKVSGCGDVLGIAWLGLNQERHNYIPMMDRMTFEDDIPFREDMRLKFIRGEEAFVGSIPLPESPERDFNQ